MKCTIYEQFSRNRGTYPILTLLEGIKSGRWAEVVNAHQRALAAGDTQEAERLKKSLPAFTVSGTYSGPRKKEFLERYTGLVVLDIDKLDWEQIPILLVRILQAPYTVFCFISPGGRGIKIVVRPVTPCPLTVENHVRNFCVAAAWYEAWLGVKVDPSGKDVGRLCFVSFDPELYIAPQYRIFLESGEEGDVPGDLPFMEGEAETPVTGKEKEVPADISALLLKARKQTSVRHKYTEGNRNNYIYHFACNCNRLGIVREAVSEYALKKFSGLGEEEMNATIDSAYAHTNEYGIRMREEEQAGQDKAAERCRREIEEIKKNLTATYTFRYNEVSHRVEYRLRHSKKPFIPMDDLMENTLWCRLREAGIACQRSTLHAVLVSDFSKTFNPFMEYFHSLPPWDGVTDAIGMLADTVQTTRQEEWHYYFRKWIVAMVACALIPDVENHTVLVLNSLQGKGKTTWCLNLVPPELRAYRYSGIPNPQSRDSMLTLSECILVNLDELGMLPMKEMNKLKEMITKGVIRERRAYGMNNEVYIRRASFTASVNTNQVLSDLTGSRRFLCFEAKVIDYLSPVDYTAVFSHVMGLLKAGFRYWLDDTEIDAVQAGNEAFRVRSPEEEFLSVWFRKPVEGDVEIQYLTATQILEVLCFKSHLQMTHGGVIKVSMVLRKEGFEHGFKGKKCVFSVVQRSNEEVSDDKKGNGSSSSDKGDGVDSEPVIPF